MPGKEEEKKKGTGLGKRLTNWIYVPEEGPPAPATGTALVRPPMASAVAQVVSTASAMPQGQAPDQKLTEAILSRIHDRGEAYLHFLEMLVSLQSVPMDEASRYPSAIATTAKAFGLTAVQILKAIEERKAALPEVSQEFEQKVAEEKGNLNKDAEEIAGIEKQITSLQQRIQDLQKDKVAKQTSISQRQTALDQEKAKFEAALQAIGKSLDADYDRISKLKGAK